MEISGQEKARFGVQKLMELAQNSNIDLRNLVDPDIIRRARAMYDASSHPVVGRNSTSPLRRTVCLGDNVDSLALGS